MWQGSGALVETLRMFDGFLALLSSAPQEEHGVVDVGERSRRGPLPGLRHRLPRAGERRRRCPSSMYEGRSGKAIKKVSFRSARRRPEGCLMRSFAILLRQVIEPSEHVSRVIRCATDCRCSLGYPGPLIRLLCDGVNPLHCGFLVAVSVCPTLGRDSQRAVFRYAPGAGRRADGHLELFAGLVVMCVVNLGASCNKAQPSRGAVPHPLCHCLALCDGGVWHEADRFCPVGGGN